jgi:D-serine deaminase-like pyridoxal phosphate-dependent protein
MPKLIDNITTPAVLIEKRIMHYNLSAMQKLADTNKVNLRVHIKTHKIPELAKLQIRLGAVGIAVAKLSEAEAMAETGIKDIQIANIIVGENRIRRLVKLSSKCRLTVAVDSIENARSLSETFVRNHSTINLLVKVNSGLNRCGLDSFDQVFSFIKKTAQFPGIKIVGLMTHAGHAYGADSRKEIRRIGRSEGKILADYAAGLRRKGYHLEILSVGSTPTARYCSAVKGITELRVGNYIFNDMTQVALGTVSKNRCALTVMATVISIPSSRRVIIDSGSKALSSDRGAHGKPLLDGYGFIVGANDTITRLSEEHGIIDSPKRHYKIGQRIRIIPNHACTVMNLFNDAYLVDGKQIIRKFIIAARGKMT